MMKGIQLIRDSLLAVFLLTITMISNAGAPVWTFTPLTATTLSVPENDTATVQYIITNQSSRAHTLSLQSIAGITQLMTGLGICGNPFILTGKASCILSLQVAGSQLTSPINDGPIVCEQGSTLQCYRPATSDILHITKTAPITTATITVTNSPLTLTTNGSTGTLTITNNSLLLTATNISSDFTGTALNGNVTETGNTCTNVAPLSSCTLTYTPGSTVISQTDFSIQGTNTNAVTAAIQIDVGVTINAINPSSGSASGGTGVTITGSGLTGATSVSFGGIAATSVNVVNSTTVTAVTPVHAAGGVDIVLTTPNDSATQTNGYTYLTTAVGQSAYGGVIACLNPTSNYLIAANADNSAGIVWSASTSTTGATSTSNGAVNTATIVAALGDNPTYAAGLCSNYEIDSQGNSPCESGNTCYNDWFLPAGNNTSAASGQLYCLYQNRGAIGASSSSSYWSSTENNINLAWYMSFVGAGFQATSSKSASLNVRCVRTFSP